jgi:hypothetical protein
MSLHDGALPGSNSFFARIRNESVGVFTLATDDSLAMAWYDIVRPLVLDDLLGLGPQEADNSTTPGGTEGDPLAGLPGKTPRPDSPRPAPESESLVGTTFAAPGYAPFTLASVDLSDSQAVEAARLPIEFMQTDIATLQGLDFSGGSIFYAAWNQTVASYLLFNHFDGPLYNVTVVYTRPSLPSASGESVPTVLGKYFGSSTAVFTDGGIGFFDGFWSSPATPGNPPAVEEGVEEAAEVYFARQ